MVKKYETTTLFIEYKNTIIQLDFTRYLVYRDYFSLTRILFKSLFKFLFFYNDTETIFILRSKNINKEITHKITNIDFFEFKNLLLNYNKFLFNEFSSITTHNYPIEQHQISYLLNLYKDPRYQEISAKQYISYLNQKIRKISQPTFTINSIEDIFTELLRRLGKQWIIQPLDISAMMIVKHDNYSNWDTEMQTILMNDPDFMKMTHEIMQITHPENLNEQSTNLQPLN
jgi:hypothetical protein